MYFTVSGGPFGLEGLVGSVGPGVALLLLVLTPLVFSVPETLLIWGATWLNLRGTRVVGTASGWFVALVLAPFAVLAVAAIARWAGGPGLSVTPFHAPGTSFLGALGLGISQAIWNYSGWDNAST